MTLVARAHPHSPCGRVHQRGAALLTAMIIVALIATLASAMVWQQWRAVQVEAAERARVQSSWVLSGALDWARLILREDGRSTSKIDDLNEPWATPLAEARLSTFLAADKDNTDDGPDAFLSGTITDAQSRYNLLKLITVEGKPDAEQVQVLERLCQTIGLADSVATQISEALREALANPPSASAALLPRSAEQLTWLGIDPATVAALAPYVVLLPPPAQATTVNVNTAPREVLAALAGIDLASAERLVQLRQGTPFQTPEAFTSQLPNKDSVKPDDISVTTQYFEVRGRLRLADHVLEQRSLVRRINNQVDVISTERVSSTDPSTLPLR